MFADDVRSLILHKQAKQAVEKYGQRVVEEEIQEMIYRDLAVPAFQAALTLNAHGLIVLAAKVITYGDYPDEAKALAKSYFVG